jgi:hypothetical protein
MVGVTWPSLLLSAGVGGKNKTSKTKTSNNSTRARSAARAYFFPLVPAQREGPSLVFRMYYTLSFSMDGQLYIFLYSHLDPITFFYLLNKTKTPKKRSDHNELHQSQMCLYFYQQQPAVDECMNSCSLPFILVPLIKVVRICWADDWFNDDDQLESQPDRYSLIIYCVDSR